MAKHKKKKKKKKLTIHAFNENDVVVTRNGTFDDYNFNISFWQGKVVEVFDEGEWIFIRWDSATLRKMPLPWIKMIENAQSDWETMILPVKRLIPGEARDKKEDVKKAVKEITSKLIF